MAYLAVALAHRSSAAVTPAVVVPAGNALLRWLGLADGFHGPASPKQGLETLGWARERHNQRLYREVIGVVSGCRNVDGGETCLVLDLFPCS